MKKFIVSIISLVHIAAGQDKYCVSTRCGESSPVIRFPFWLKDHRPLDCGYPGFELSCTKSNGVEFELQFPITVSTNNIVLPLKVKVSIVDIDYKEQTLLISDLVPQSCFPNKIPTVNSSASLFDTTKTGHDGYTFLNCSKPTDYGYKVNCLSGRNYHVIAFASFQEIRYLPEYSSCFRMYNVSYIPESALTGRNEGYISPYNLHWYKPSCGHCEAQGKYCSSKINSTRDEIECFDHEQPRPRKGSPRKLIGCIISGVFLLVFIIIGLYCITGLMKRKRTSKV